MEVSVALQLRGLWLSAGAGVAAGLIYDLLRVLRRRFPGGAAAFLADTAFWLGVGLTLLQITIRSGTGVVRWYYLAFLAGGFWLYCRLAGRWIFPLLLFWAAFLEKMGKGALFPLVWIWERGKFFSKKAKNHFHYWKKWVIVDLLFVERRPKPPSDRRKGAKGE